MFKYKTKLHSLFGKKTVHPSDKLALLWMLLISDPLQRLCLKHKDNIYCTTVNYCVESNGKQHINDGRCFLNSC